MKSYEKPVVLANDEVAEGVYAGSGKGDGCFKYFTYWGSNFSDADGFYEYNVEFVHDDVAHMECTHKICIHFNGSTPIAARCKTNCTDYEIKGNNIIVTWAQQQANGGNEHTTIGIKVQWSGAVGYPTKEGSYGWRV